MADTCHRLVPTVEFPMARLDTGRRGFMLAAVIGYTGTMLVHPYDSRINHLHRCIMLMRIPNRSSVSVPKRRGRQPVQGHAQRLLGGAG